MKFKPRLWTVYTFEIQVSNKNLNCWRSPYHEFPLNSMKPFRYIIRCYDFLLAFELSCFILWLNSYYYSKIRHYPGDLRSDILRNNAHKITYIRKKRKVNVTEKRRNGGWMPSEGRLSVLRHGDVSSCANNRWKWFGLLHGYWIHVQ